MVPQDEGGLFGRPRKRDHPQRSCYWRMTGLQVLWAPKPCGAVPGCIERTLETVPVAGSMSKRISPEGPPNALPTRVPESIKTIDPIRPMSVLSVAKPITDPVMVSIL